MPQLAGRAHPPTEGLFHSLRATFNSHVSNPYAGMWRRLLMRRRAAVAPSAEPAATGVSEARANATNAVDDEC